MGQRRDHLALRPAQSESRQNLKRRSGGAPLSSSLSGCARDRIVLGRTLLLWWKHVTAVRPKGSRLLVSDVSDAAQEIGILPSVVASFCERYE